jgi:hypothetical protein
MAYILTQEDIDRFGLTDAIAGDEATAEELQKMFPAQMNEQEQSRRQTETSSMSFPVPSSQAAESPQTGYMNEYSALRDLGLGVGQTEDVLAAIGDNAPATVTIDQSDTSRYQPTFSEMSLAQRGLDTPQTKSATNVLLEMLSQPISSDPFEGLSKDQRRTLLFAGLSDAGAALQGRQGSAVSDTLSQFRGLKDMERKRQIQVAQLEQEKARQAQIDALLMDAPMTGAAPAADVTGMPKSTVSLEQQIAALRSQLGTYASLDQMDMYNARMSELEGDLEAANVRETAEKEKIQVSEGKLLEARGAMSAAKRALSAALGMEEGEAFDQYLESAVAGGEFDPSSFFITRQGFIPDTRRFKDFQAAANQLGAIMTFQNMADVIKAGAKLGILSDSDIRLLGSLSGVIDPENMPVQSAENILRLYDKLGQTITRLEGELGGLDEVDAMLKKYGIE